MIQEQHIQARIAEIKQSQTILIAEAQARSQQLQGLKQHLRTLELQIVQGQAVIGELEALLKTEEQLATKEGEDVQVAGVEGQISGAAGI